LQIFNIEMRSKTKSHEMTEAVVFWKWVSANTLALVTGNAVYHWSMEGTAAPEKMFDRHASLANAQIINYRTDAAEKWLVLVGIAQGEGGRITGAMQLYSTEKKVSQPIEGHAAVFAKFKTEGSSTESTLFSFAVKGAAGAKLHVIEVSKGDDAAPAFQKRTVEIYFPPEAQQDFPVAMQYSEKFGIIFLVSKFGYVHLYDVETGTFIYMNRISQDMIFVTCPHASSSGLMGINRRGQVLVISIDEQNLVPYLIAQNNQDLAMKVAGRGGASLAGGEALYAQQFDALLKAFKFKEAVEMAAKSPGGVLRTKNTIQKLQQIPVVPGQANPLLQYFGLLLEQGKLNQYETIELARPVLQQGKQQMLERWLKEDKLECSEDLGDMVKQVNPQLALSIYLRANVPAKVVASFVEIGSFDKILVYAQKVGYQADYTSILQTIAQRNPKGALEFALVLAQNEGGSLVDFTAVVELFMGRNMLQETTSFLLDVLKQNKPEEGPLQTRLLEINLMAAPQVADAIMANEMFTHYDKPRIAGLCERAGLAQRALEHYSELDDIKRVIINTQAMNPEFLVNFFGTLSVEWAVECLKTLLDHNIRGNLQICVQIATKYNEQLTPASLIELFENAKSFEGLYYYLGAIVNFSQEPDVHYKYIVAACKVGQMKNDYKEVERVTRESEYYPPEETKEFLKSLKLTDPRPLINVCDRFNFVEELTNYLYSNNMMRYIEVYVQKVNPTRTPEVVGALIDAGCAEETIKTMINGVRQLCPIEELVASCEERNRLKMLLPWLEARYDEGNQEPGLHNALAKIYIDTGKAPEKFLETNRFYDSRVVGKYCEKRDPHLAVMAYKRGECDEELIEVTNNNGLFKAQARYLVERQNLELWATVLTDDNEHKRSLIDQVVSTALPASTDAEEVSITVKAFMTADLPNELIELLEKIVLQGTQFSNNKNLQNLLILTAIKADKDRVMEYINRLDNFDGADIAGICVGSELFEEAFVIYKKNEQQVDAISVLLDNIGDVPRAQEYAKTVDIQEVWTTLANAELRANMIPEAVEAYVKADDPSNFNDVITAAEAMDCYADLIKYLTMARKKVKEQRIDTSLIMCYAKTDSLSDLEEFINGPNVAQIQHVGDRCFDEGFYEAAKMLFSNISNFGRLASALVKLKRFQEAVEAARKANFTRTWKEVLEACVEEQEFRLAQMCGLNIINVADEIEEVIKVYERRGYFEELIHLMESGLGVEMGGSSAGIFTELACLYSNYKPEKLMEHIKLFHSRMNIPRVIRTCDRNQDWAELVFLCIHNDEFDNAATTMMMHSVEAWDHMQFKDVMNKCSNPENYYRAVNFYLEFNPSLLNDLLISLAGRVDHSRVVQMTRMHHPLLKKYLVHVQSNNVAAVNEALNKLYIDEEDFEAMQTSIDTFDNFDQLATAAACDKHELLEFRKLSAYLYKKNGKFEQSIELSKKDKLYRIAMETAAASGNSELVENVLRYFVELGSPECFAAGLFTCYENVKPDLVLELAWRNNMMDFAMPYLIQFVAEFTKRVEGLTKETEKVKETTEQMHEQQQQAAVDMTMQETGQLYLTYGGGPYVRTSYVPQC